MVNKRSLTVRFGISKPYLWCVFPIIKFKTHQHHAEYDWNSPFISRCSYASSILQRLETKNYISQKPLAARILNMNLLPLTKFTYKRFSMPMLFLLARRDCEAKRVCRKSGGNQNQGFRIMQPTLWASRGICPEAASQFLDRIYGIILHSRVSGIALMPAPPGRPMIS